MLQDFVTQKLDTVVPKNCTICFPMLHIDEVRLHTTEYSMITPSPFFCHERHRKLVKNTMYSTNKFLKFYFCKKKWKLNAEI